MFFLRYLQHKNESKWIESQKSLVYWEKIRLNYYITKAGMYWILLNDLFSAYQVIQAWCEQSKPLKWSWNYICGKKYLKYFLNGKVYMKLSVEPERKLILRQNNFGPFFVFQLCANFSRSAVLLYVEFRTD